MTTTESATPLQITIRPPEAAKTAITSFWSGDAPSFQDVLDTINPLQHIPFVANAYQAATGEVPSVGSKLLGGALFGGPIGFVASLFNTILKDATGSDLSENIIAAVSGDDVPAMNTTTFEVADSVNASRRTAYNAYLQSQSLLA